MSRTTDLIHSNNNFERLLSGFQDIKKVSNYYIVSCPSCKKKEFYIYQNANGGQCNRKNKCDYKISFYEYYGHDEFYRICRTNRIDKKQFQNHVNRTQRISQPTKTFQAHKTFFEPFFFESNKALLKSQSGLEYLNKRGAYQAKDLLGYSKKDNAILFFHKNDQNKITGVVKGFIGSNNNPKYLKGQKNKGHSFQYPFLWEYVDHNPEKTLMIVEGYFDALSLHLNGYRAVGIGTAVTSFEKQKLIGKKSSNVIFCCDNDSKAKILKTQVSKIDLTIFGKVSLLLPVSLKENKDLNDYFCNHESTYLDFIHLKPSDAKKIPS